MKKTNECFVSNDLECVPSDAEKKELQQMFDQIDHFVKILVDDGHPEAELMQGREMLITRLLKLTKNSYLDTRTFFKKYHENTDGEYLPVVTDRFVKEKVMNEMSNGNRNLSYVFMDLDGLKSVNDIAGHPEGNIFLEKSMDILQKATADSLDEYCQNIINCILKCADPDNSATADLNKDDLIKIVAKYFDIYISSHGGDEYGVLIIGPEEAKLDALLEEIKLSFPTLANSNSEIQNEVRSFLKLSSQNNPTSNLKPSSSDDDHETFNGTPIIRRRYAKILKKNISSNFDSEENEKEFKKILSSDRVINKFVEIEDKRTEKIFNSIAEGLISKKEVITEIQKYYGHLAGYNDLTITEDLDEVELIKIIESLSLQATDLISKKYQSYEFMPSMAIGEIYMEDDGWKNEENIQAKLAEINKNGEVPLAPIIAEYAVFLDACDSKMYEAKNEYKAMLDNHVEANNELAKEYEKDITLFTNFLSQKMTEEDQGRIVENINSRLTKITTLNEELRDGKQNDRKKIIKQIIARINDEVEFWRRLQSNKCTNEDGKLIEKNIPQLQSRIEMIIKSTAEIEMVGLHAEIIARNSREMKLSQENKTLRNERNAYAGRVSSLESKLVDKKQEEFDFNQKILELAQAGKTEEIILLVAKRQEELMS